MAISARDSGISTLITINEIIEQKRKLEEILSKYGVKKAEEIEDKIKNKKIPEHPSYEDYLSALSFENNIRELKNATARMIREI